MIVSQQYQIQTDNNGKPVAFHKLRSIRMDNQPPPQIQYYNQSLGMHNIMKSPNNMHNIQYMPVNYQNKKGLSIVEILLLVVIIGTAGMLLLDMYQSYQKGNKSISASNENIHVNNDKEYDQKQVENNEDVKSRENEIRILIQGTLDENTPKIQPNNQSDSIEQINDKNEQKVQQDVGINEKTQNIYIVSADDKSGQWIFDYFLEQLNLQQKQQQKAAKSKNNKIASRMKPIHINNFRQQLIYKSTDKQWSSFLLITYNQFQCIKDVSTRKYYKYCKELSEKINKYGLFQL